MQIPTVNSIDFILALSVGLATIGVCVFCAFTSVGALFISQRFIMKKRSLLAMFLLMGCFEGIYLIYWTVSVQNSLKYDTKQSRIGGGIAILLMIITLGLYSLIWQWKVCKNLKYLGAKDHSILTLILSIFIIGIIINPLIIQSSINNAKYLPLK